MRGHSCRPMDVLPTLPARLVAGLGLLIAMAVVSCAPGPSPSTAVGDAAADTVGPFADALDGTGPGLPDDATAGDSAPLPDGSGPQVDPDAISRSQLALNRSGTRIKMRVGSTPDGAKEFHGWHDDVLGVDCYFSRATDGARRCLPATAHLWAGTLLGNAYFADEQCTARVLVQERSARACLRTIRFIVLNLAGDAVDDCGSPIDSLAVYDLPAQWYAGPLYELRDGCIRVDPSGLTDIAGRDLYALGAQVPPDRFQAMTEAVE